jgi:large subunit ribosomal protein L29
MATKKFLELQEFSDADLAAELVATKAQFQNLKFDHAIKGLDNPIVLREVRKDIARIQTELRRRAMSQMTEAQLAKRSKIRNRRRKK